MSISSQITTAKRAVAAVKAAQAAQAAPVAKRGMFALVERHHSYQSLRDGHHAWATFTPAIVASVGRDGLAKAVRLAGQPWLSRQHEWRTITVDARGLIADPEAVAAALVDGDGHAVEYPDQATAVAAIKAAAGLQ